MPRYVLGFAFTENNQVLLVEKLRPSWQHRALNGIGGKVKSGETHMQAMIREAEEEVGLTLDWTPVGELFGTNRMGLPFDCGLYYHKSNRVFNFQNLENEQKMFIPANHISEYRTVTNVQWLVPLLACGDKFTFISAGYGLEAKSNLHNYK